MERRAIKEIKGGRDGRELVHKEIRDSKAGKMPKDNRDSKAGKGGKEQGLKAIKEFKGRTS
jgi:hypothetical protein